MVQTQKMGGTARETVGFPAAASVGMGNDVLDQMSRPADKSGLQREMQVKGQSRVKMELAPS